MKTELISTPINVEQADTATLRKELVSALTMTARQLGYLATIWKELERRGEDLSELRMGIAAYLPMIANGKLDADLVVKYAGQKMLLAAAAKLTLAEQHKLAESGYVTVLKLDGLGQRTEVQTPLHRLAANDVRHIFGETHIRTIDEQFLLLAKAKKPAAKKIRKTSKVGINERDRSIIVGGASITLEKLLPVLSEYYGFDVAARLGEPSSTA